MGLLSTLLLVFAILWVSQMVGTYFQMRHYRRVLGGITRAGNRGYVGVGNAKARFGKGVILILVVDEDDRVEKAMKMRGMTVFARFKEDPELVGMELDELRTGEFEESYEKAAVQAARRAVEQIDQIKEEKAEAIR